MIKIIVVISDVYTFQNLKIYYYLLFSFGRHYFKGKEIMGNIKKLYDRKKLKVK